MAELYATAFPDPYVTALERHAVGAFADVVSDSGIDGDVVDVGCGLGQVTDDLARRGLPAVGVDPSVGMLTLARQSYPALRFVSGDATLEALDDGEIAAVIARFSLIHIPPTDVPAVLRTWAARVTIGGTVLVAGHANDEPGVIEFDHRVSRAWRWHPDMMADALSAAGFDEVWRTISRPDPDHRFPEFHVLARRR